MNLAYTANKTQEECHKHGMPSVTTNETRNETAATSAAAKTKRPSPGAGMTKGITKGRARRTKSKYRCGYCTAVKTSECQPNQRGHRLIRCECRGRDKRGKCKQHSRWEPMFGHADTNETVVDGMIDGMRISFEVEELYTDLCDLRVWG